MLTYTPPKPNAIAKPTEKPWLLLLLCCVWLWPGIFGHNVWKPDEPYIYQAILNMMEHGEALAPSVHEHWYLHTPPLYIWVGALFYRLFSPWALTGMDAARLATPFFLSLGFAFAGGAGRELLGKRNGRSVVLILIGCAGLMVVGHQMDSMSATFMGIAMGLYALSIAPRSPALAGFLLGFSWAVVFLSASPLVLIFMMILACVLPVFHFWRNKSYVITLLFAFAVALPLCLVWPITLYKNYPVAFEYWWHSSVLDSWGRMGESSFWRMLTYYPKVVLWFAFPAWPLALWAAIKRKAVPKHILQLCGLWFGLALVLLSVMPKQENAYAILLLLPLAVLGAAQLDSLRRGASSFLNWFGVMTFGMVAIFIWLGFFAMNYGFPEKLAERSAYFSPYYTPEFSFFAIFFAVCITPVWIWAMTRKHLRGRQAVTNWAAGMTFIWALIFTLWLPWLDKIKSYRPVVDSMEDAMPQSLVNSLKNGRTCIATERGNLSLITAWDEYSWVKPELYTQGEPIPCEWRLVVNDEWHTAPPDGWLMVWQGARPRDKREIFALWRRKMD